MAEELELQPEVVETPVVDPAPVVVEQSVEIVYEYQPVDDLDRPLGNKQVFKGANWQEITDKVAKANKELVRLNRDLNKKVRLGQIETDNIPDSVTRIQNTDIKPKPLTSDERYQLSRDIMDAEKFEQAAQRIVESTVGDPNELRESIRQTQEELKGLRAKEEARLFLQRNADYYVCQENWETISSWMIKNNLAPIATNFEYAFSELKNAGLMLDKPIVSAPVEPVVAPVAAPVEAPVQRIPVSINKNVASDNGISPAAAAPKKWTKEQIEKMSGDEYKRNMRDPEFLKFVNGE